MKRSYIFIVGLVCIGVCIGLWLLGSKPPAKVVRIYKAIPYEPKPVGVSESAAGGTRLSPSLSDKVSSDTPQTEQTDESTETDLLTDPELSPEAEEEAFWEWLSTLESELPPEADREAAEETDSELETEDSLAEIPYWKLSKMVIEAYDLKEVINSYFDVDAGYCPKCDQQDFQLIRNAKNSRLEYWCCLNCYNVTSDVIGFVAWIEGIEVREAAKDLAVQAGLLE